MQNTLQAELIHSLETVGPFTDDPKLIDRITHAIKNVVIPPEDYEKVLQFIFAVLNQFPEIMEATPNDEALRKLCLACLNETTLQDAQSTTFRKHQK